MTVGGMTRGQRLAVRLAAVVSAVLAVLGAGHQANAVMPWPPAAASATSTAPTEEHDEGEHQHEVQALTVRSTGPLRAGGGPLTRTSASPRGTDAAYAALVPPAAPMPAGPVPAANGSRPAALARIQVFRC